MREVRQSSQQGSTHPTSSHTTVPASVQLFILQHSTIQSLMLLEEEDWVQGLHIYYNFRTTYEKGDIHTVWGFERTTTPYQSGTALYWLGRVRVWIAWKLKGLINVLIRISWGGLPVNIPVQCVNRKYMFQQINGLHICGLFKAYYLFRLRSSC